MASSLFISTAVLLAVVGRGYPQADIDIPAITQHPRGKVAKAEEIVSLACEASEGVHLIRWYRSEVLVQEGPGYVIASFGEEFAGNYTCRATINGVGTVTSAIASVELATLVASPPGEPGAAVSVSVPLNHPYTLSCGNISSTPPLQYIWKSRRNRDPFFATHGIVKGIDGKLYFQLVTEAVEDTYICRVSNDHLGVSQAGYISLTTESDPGSSSDWVMMAAPTDLVVNEGDPASFQCIVGGSPLVTASDIMWISPTSYNILLHSNNAVVYIEAASLAHAGSYSCTVTELGTFSANLTVLVPPIMSVTPLSQYTPIFGDQLSITCDSNNTMVQEWVWFHDGVRLTSSASNTLTISSVHTTDSGLYQCFAYNSAGNVSHTTRVTVTTIPATLRETSLPSPQLLFADSHVTYRCTAHGAPPPEIIWLHNGSPLATAESREDEETRETTSVLELDSVTRGDSGVYQCRAVNEVDGTQVGSDQAEARLEVIAQTVVTSPNTAQPLLALEEEREAILPCLAKAQEDVTLNFTWFKDNVPVTYDGVRLSLVTGRRSANISLQSVEKGDAGMYLCEVVSLLDGLESSAVRSAHLQVTTAPKLLIPPEIHPVTEITSSSFQIDWYFPGQDALTKLTSYRISYAQLGETTPEGSFNVPVNGDNSIVISSSPETPVKPYTEYMVWVIANYKTGEMLGSNLTVVTSEDVPGAPEEVTGIVVNFTTVRVQWKPPTEPNGIITNYTVRHRRDTETSTYKTMPLNSNSTHHYIIGLETTSSYVVEVAASTSVGLGPFSQSVTISTETMQGVSPVYERVWFIVVMFVVALVLMMMGVLGVGGVRYALVSRRSNKNRYNVQSKVEMVNKKNGCSTRSLTEEDMRDYNGRGSRLNGESSNIGLLLDGQESESSMGAKYSYEPSISTVSHISSMAPAYINPPSFREAIKSLHSTRLSPAYSGSTLDQAPPSTVYTVDTDSSFWLDSGSKTRILQQMVDASPSPARSYQPSPLPTSSPPPPPIPTAHRPGTVPPPPPLPQSPTHSEHMYASLNELDYAGSNTRMGEDKELHPTSPGSSHGSSTNGYNRLPVRPSSQQRVRTNSTPQYRTTSPQAPARFSPLNHTVTASAAAASSSQDFTSPFQTRSGSQTMSSSQANPFYMRSSSHNVRSNTTVGVGLRRGSAQNVHVVHQQPLLAKTSSQPNFATFV